MYLKDKNEFKKIIFLPYIETIYWVVKCIYTREKNVSNIFSDRILCIFFFFFIVWIAWKMIKLSLVREIVFVIGCQFFNF